MTDLCRHTTLPHRISTQNQQVFSCFVPLWGCFSWVCKKLRENIWTEQKHALLLCYARPEHAEYNRGGLCRIVRQLVCMIYDSIKKNHKTCWWLQKNWFHSVFVSENVCFMCHFVSFADNYGGYENQLFKGNSQTVLFSIHGVCHMINVALSIEWKVCRWIWWRCMMKFP